MRRMIDVYCKALQIVSAGLLAVMVALVFGNVVLRYVFNSGIAVSEELSRWLFVWLTFLGGIYALREHAHLGSDIVIARIGAGPRKLCLLVGYAAMLWICWLLFSGALVQTRLNWSVTAPSSGLSVAIFYSSGLVFAMSAAVILLLDAWDLVTGRESGGPAVEGAGE